MPPIDYSSNHYFTFNKEIQIIFLLCHILNRRATKKWITYPEGLKEITSFSPLTQFHFYNLIWFIIILPFQK